MKCMPSYMAAANINVLKHNLGMKQCCSSGKEKKLSNWRRAYNRLVQLLLIALAVAVVYTMILNH